MNSYWKSNQPERRSDAYTSGRSRSIELTPERILAASERDQLYTRTGSKVSILCVERKHPHYPVVGLARVDAGGPEEVLTFTQAGRYSANGGESEFDLVIRERKRVFYVGLKHSEEGAVISTPMHNSKEDLFEENQRSFDAVAKVTWES